MNYQVIIQPAAFQEIETFYRWMCDNLSPELANNWYYELQDAIASLQKFPNLGMRSGQHKLLRAIVPGMEGIIGGCDRCVMVYVYE